ncbi:MAG: hypothetical protein KME17_16045 [Cyanosarcina radialis HA8281-LM2]|jgi:hypothetical protein|nr:hypothetical protein [Cyanosarcina radialis HA8281-LM2]
MPKSRAYDDELILYLQDSQRAIAYLNGALEEEDPEFLLLALQNVARAKGKTVDFGFGNRVNESGELALQWHELVKMLNELGLGLAVKDTSQAA